MTNTETESAVESFCIFQIGDTLFAMGAAHLREVALRPELADVPDSGEVLAGLWHEGSEFLPVLRLPCHRPQTDAEPHMLVVKGPQSAWGLLVDGVLGIEKLTCSHAHPNEDREWSAAATGTSTWQGQNLHILSAEGVYRLAEKILQNNAISS